MCKVVLNSELNGVELYFEGKPVQSIIDSLKSLKFRWNRAKLCWYAKQSAETIAEAKKYSDSEIHTEEVKTVSKKATKKNISLWDRVQFVEGKADNSEMKRNYKFVGANYTGLSVKETAKEIRSHLRKLFPEVKFSVTSDYNGIDVEIKSSPYCNEKLEYSRELSCTDYRNFEKEHNKELIAIKKYCEQLLNSYRFDDSDSMTDYFCTNFYGKVSIAYEYIQTEQTEVIKNDIEDFRNKLIEAKKAEEERKQAEWQEYQKQREEEHKQYLIRKAQEEKEIEQINNEVEVKELDENNQYMVINSDFANLNKNATLDQYKEEVVKGDYYKQDIKITREIHFSNIETLENFSNLLLNDFEFINGTGGSYTDDNRINSMSDYDNMDSFERKTVKFNSLGIAVYLNDKIQFVIDAQGYSYSRYVGLIAEDTTIIKEIKYNQLLSDEEIEERTEVAEKVIELNNIVIENNNIDSKKLYSSDNWNVFRKEISQSIRNNKIKLNKDIIQQIKENEYIKTLMYRLIRECEPVQDQFINADIQEGEKLTIIKSSIMAGASISHITFKEWKQEEYAQYKDNIKIIMNVNGKNGLYSTNLTNDKILIYKGWFELPISVLWEKTDGGKITKFGSYDDKALEDILTYFESNNILPVINTYRPVF